MLVSSLINKTHLISYGAASQYLLSIYYVMCTRHTEDKVVNKTATQLVNWLPISKNFYSSILPGFLSQSWGKILSLFSVILH